MRAPKEEKQGKKERNTPSGNMVYTIESICEASYYQDQDVKSYGSKLEFIQQSCNEWSK